MVQQDGRAVRQDTAARVVGVLLPVSGGITILGALLLFTAVLGVGSGLLALLSLACGVMQIVLGTAQRAGEAGTTRAIVSGCLASSFVAALLLGVGSGATLLAVVLPLVVVALLGADDARRVGRRLRRVHGRTRRRRNRP